MIVYVLLPCDFTEKMVLIAFSQLFLLHVGVDSSSIAHQSYIKLNSRVVDKVLDSSIVKKGKTWK